MKSALLESFFKELDRRIDAPDYPEQGRENLKVMRPWLKIAAASDPERFEKDMRQILTKYFPDFKAEDWR